MQITQLHLYLMHCPLLENTEHFYYFIIKKETVAETEKFAIKEIVTLPAHKNRFL